MVTYITDKKYASQASLIDFIKSVDKDFTPPLTGRVDIDAWVNKIYNNGLFVIAVEGENYVGCLLFYANDLLTANGYISYLAVDTKCRRLGIAGRMLSESVDISKKAGMESMSVYTNNPGALALYIKYGFKVKSQEFVSEYKVVSTFLSKNL